MTQNCYIIDTSSLVRLNKETPLDIYPSVWKNIGLLIREDRLIAPKEVFNEISRVDDQLKTWAKKQKKMFKEPTEKQIQIVRDILKKYPSLVNTESKFSADPWVIALTQELATSPQMTLFAIKRIVVTEEKLRGNRVRIPFVCEAYSIEAIDILSMFRAEGWKF